MTNKKLLQSIAHALIGAKYSAITPAELQIAELLIESGFAKWITRDGEPTFWIIADK